jgi:hypothetical protein
VSLIKGVEHYILGFDCGNGTSGINYNFPYSEQQESK